MSGRTVTVGGGRITDRESFHDVFSEAFGFPDWYGRNMDAWIDLFTCMDDPESMTGVSVAEGETVTIRLEGARDMKARVPDLYDDLIESAAFVNWRRLEKGDPALLCLAFHE